MCTRNEDHQRGVEGAAKDAWGIRRGTHPTFAQLFHNVEHRLTMFDLYFLAGYWQRSRKAQLRLETRFWNELLGDRSQVVAFRMLPKLNKGLCRIAYAAEWLLLLSKHEVMKRMGKLLKTSDSKQQLGRTWDARSFQLLYLQSCWSKTVFANGSIMFNIPLWFLNVSCIFLPMLLLSPCGLGLLIKAQSLKMRWLYPISFSGFRS